MDSAGSPQAPRDDNVLNRTAWLCGSAITLAACWWALWTLRTYWNPVFFFGLWTSATVFARTLTGDEPLPWRRQLALMALSVPLWWWFEFINEWVQNWQYHSLFDYGPLEHTLLATLTFSTVVPALDAAWRLAFRVASLGAPASCRPGPWLGFELAAGLIAQTAIFLVPTVFYPLVWVAPFLVLDALVGYGGGTNLMALIARRQLALPVAIGLAGVGCGFFWEMWNFYASPKWTYAISYLHFLQVFEMPVLGYGGYVPFAWAVYQLVRLVGRLGLPTGDCLLPTGAARKGGGAGARSTP